MGRKKKQHGKTKPEVSEKMQQELMAGRGAFGWWSQLEKLLTEHPSFRPEGHLSILLPLCWENSELSDYLYNAGFKNITSLYCDEDDLRVMLERHERVRPEMKWRHMDVVSMELEFANETFDAIVDEYQVGSLMKAIPGSSSLYLSQVKRVLKAGGIYVCLTLAERDVLELLFRMFRFGWAMSLYTVGPEALSIHTKLQIFMVVAEKMSSPDDLCEVFRRENMIRLEYADDPNILYSLEDLHLGAIGNLSELVPGRRVNLLLGIPEGFVYTGVLLDAKEDSGPFTSPFAVFLVPQNQALDRSYTSEEGQWHIVVILKASRLLVIFLDSNNSALSMADIQKDLSPSAELLKPRDCEDILYLLDKDKKQEILYKGSSVLTGPIVVADVIYRDEDIKDDDYKGCTFRCLIFERNDRVVQSEALLSLKESNRISTDVGKGKEQQASKHKKKGRQRKSDSQSSSSPVSSCEVKVVHNHLVSAYHSGIVFGIRLISSYWKVSTSARGLVNTVVIGLGGGLLPMYMKNYLPSLKIEVVELDRKVLQVAKEFFGFSDDESLKVHIKDGTMFVKEKADENNSCKIDILVVDVDSSSALISPAEVLISPAEVFVDESFLLTVKDSLSEQGVFIINLFTASSVERNAVHSRVKKVFSCILSLPIEEDFAEVLFALKTTGSTIKEDQLSEACREFAKSLEHEKKWIDEEVDLSKSIKLLN